MNLMLHHARHYFCHEVDAQKARLNIVVSSHIQEAYAELGSTLYHFKEALRKIEAEEKKETK